MPAINVMLRPAWRNYWAGLTVAGFLLFITLVLASLGGDGSPWSFSLVLAFVILLYIVLKRFSWKFTIDENRVARHYGIISRRQQSVRIKDLRSVELSQSFFQRIFGIGDLAFYSAGSATAEVRFFGIKKPSAWRDKIDIAMDHLKGSSE